MSPEPLEQGLVERRGATEADHPFLCALYRTTRDDVATLDWPEDQQIAFCTQQWWAQHRDYSDRFPDSVHEVLVVAGVDVGRAWTDRRPDEVRLLDIAILPEHRRRGIGTSVLRRLQAEVSGTGIALRHSVEASNTEAKAWYERLGFVVIDDWQTHLLMEWRPA